MHRDHKGSKPTSINQSTRVLSSGIKRLWCEPDNCRPSCAVVKKTGAVPHFPLCIHGIHRDSFTITFLHKIRLGEFFFLKEDAYFIQSMYITLNKNLTEEDRLYLKYLLVNRQLNTRKDKLWPCHVWYLPCIWHQGQWSLQSSLITVWSLPWKDHILCRKWCMWKRIWVFWIVIVCSSLSGFQCFEASYCLYVEGCSIHEEYPFEWMWCFPLKHKELLTQQHNITCKKNWILRCCENFKLHNTCVENPHRFLYHSCCHRYWQCLFCHFQIWFPYCMMNNFGVILNLRGLQE